jgi:hypothetical protein
MPVGPVAPTIAIFVMTGRPLGRTEQKVDIASFNATVTKAVLDALDTVAVRASHQEPKRGDDEKACANGRRQYGSRERVTTRLCFRDCWLGASV